MSFNLKKSQGKVCDALGLHPAPPHCTEASVLRFLVSPSALPYTKSANMDSPAPHHRTHLYVKNSLLSSLLFSANWCILETFLYPSRGCLDA